MTMKPMAPGTTPTSDLSSAIAVHKFVRVAGSDLRSKLTATGSLGDWEPFAASWANLGPDTYMADGGRYRRRRHAVFAAHDIGAITRAAHQPHYQSLDHNNLNGGVERWFEPVWDRERLNDITKHFATAFLNQSLLGDKNAGQYLQSNLFGFLPRTTIGIKLETAK